MTMTDGEMKNNGDSPRCVPDFIIAGAMKCGTTSMRYILDNHPKIFMPDTEVWFYDVDDHFQHPDLFLYNGREWFYPRYPIDSNEYVGWYKSLYEKAGEDQLKGEDSSSYLASEMAAERIAQMNPDTKIILMLRDPASRTYSHYWHQLRAGKVFWNFENTLRIMPRNLIQRSLYTIQVERFLRFIPRENILFVLFEEFIQNKQGTFEEVCRFLGLSTEDLDLDKMETHYNPAEVPKYITLQIWRNRLLRRKIKTIYYYGRLLDSPDYQDPPEGILFRIVNRVHRAINPVRETKPPKMKIETRRFLNSYFSLQNKGFGELIGKDVDSHWYRE